MKQSLAACCLAWDEGWHLFSLFRLPFMVRLSFFILPEQVFERMKLLRSRVGGASICKSILRREKAQLSMTPGHSAFRARGGLL